MLTSSWGSWSTTTTLMRQTNTVRNAECGMRSVKVGVARRTTLPCNSAFRTPHSAFDSSHQLQHPEPLRILPVSTQPHPAVAAAPHELPRPADPRSEEHTSELQSRLHLVCRLLLEKKKKTQRHPTEVPRIL